MELGTQTDVKEQPKVEETPKERKLRQMMRERYADEVPEDDSPEAWEGIEDKFADDISGDLNKLGQYKESDEAIQEVMIANPELGQIVYDVLTSKMPVRAAIAKHFDSEDFTPKEGDDDYSDYQEQYNQRLEKNKQYQALQKEIDANEEASIKLIDDFAAEKGLGDEEKDALLAKIDQAFVDVLNKKVSKQILEAFYKDSVFDEEMKTAEQAGEIRGRNSSIEDIKKKSAAAKTGDGIPTPAKGGEPTEKPKKRDGLFDGIRERRGI